MSLASASEGATTLAPDVWVAQLQKKIKTQSRIWRQLRNQVVGLTGNPDLKEVDRLNSLKGKAREQVRDLIESSLEKNTSNNNNGFFLEQALCYYLKKRPDAAHAMKLAVNRVCVHHPIRFYTWKALLSRDVIEPPTATIPLQIKVFERCLDFVSAYPSLSFVVANFNLLRLMEELSKVSNLSIQHSIAIAVPLLSVIKDDIDSVDPMKMYKNIVYSLEKRVQNVEGLIEKQGKFVVSEIKLADPTLYKSLVSLGFERLQGILKVLLSTLFIGPLKFDTTLHIYDQFIQCSLDLSNDATLPSVEQWITWICSSFLLLTRALFIDHNNKGGVNGDDGKGNDLVEYFTKSVSKVTANDLAATLERYFVKLVRDVLISEIIPLHHSSSNMDDVVSVTEDDLIELEEPGYEREIKVWRRKIIAQRKVRLQKLMQRWKSLAKGICLWIRFVNTIKSKAFDRKRIEQATNIRKESIILPTIPTFSSRENVAPEKTKKLPSDTFTMLGENGNVELSLAGTILQNLVTTTSFLFGGQESSASTLFLEQSEDLDRFMPSVFLETTSAGDVQMNPAGEIMLTLIRVADFILT